MECIGVVIQFGNYVMNQYLGIFNDLSGYLY